jgi:hypothetical protein
MRADKQELTILSSVGNGSVARVGYMTQKSIQIDGNLVGDLEIQITLNEASGWHKYGNTVTGPGIYEVPVLCQAVRVRTASYSSGAATALLLGLNSRTDG